MDFLLADTGSATSPSAIDRGDTHSHTELLVDLLLHFVDRSETLPRAAVLRYLTGKATTGTKLSGSAFTLGLGLSLAFGFALALKVLVVAVPRAELASYRFRHKLLFAADADLLFEWSRLLGRDSLDGPGVGYAGVVQ